MTYKVLSAFILGAMIATPTLAQTTAETPATNPASSENSSGTSLEVDPAQTPATPAPAASEPMVTTPAAGAVTVAVPEGYTMTELTAVTADQLKGVDIYDPMDAKIAEIADVVIGDGDKVTGIVTDVGGFLGMGEHRVSLSPEQVTIYKNADNAMRAYVAMTKDELKALPKFEAPN